MHKICEYIVFSYMNICIIYHVLIENLKLTIKKLKQKVNMVQNIEEKKRRVVVVGMSRDLCPMMP